MRTISVKFVDNTFEFNINNNFIINFLRQHYNVVLSDKPDFLFYSSFGNAFLNYSDSIRIWYNFENVRPNFNYCDYAVSYDRLEFGERYLRLKRDVVKPLLDDNNDYINRKFCNFVYHQTDMTDGQRLRMEFCKALAKYKHIDCPGRALNNMQGDIKPRFSKESDWASSKIKFISDYKFTIAFENASYPGYVTEKLIQPFLANSVPIYFGDPDIELDFNPSAFINCKWTDKFDEALEKVIY